MRTVIGSCVAALLISSSAAAQSGPTGNWTGTYTFSVTLAACQNQTFTSSGNVAATLLQTGTSLSGRIDLTSFPRFGGTCSPTPTEITRVLIGSISGSGVTLSFPNDSNATQFTGSIDGNSITAQISDANGATGSLTITRTAGDPPVFDLTGTSSGNYNFTDRCSNGGTQNYTGPFTLGLTQSGANAGGVVTMQNVPLYDQNCAKITSLNMSLAAAGTVSGSTFTGGAFDPSGSFEFPVSATITNASLSGTVAGANGTGTTGTFTLNRDSTAVPASDFSGTYSGSYVETDNETSFCLNIGGLQFNGPASLTIVQAGTAISGWLIFQNAEDVSSDGFGGCFVVNISDEVLPLYGSLSGNTLTLRLPLGGGVEDDFIVTFDGDTANGTITDSFGDMASFTAAKSNIAPPVIDSFAAAPFGISAGQSATLSWSTTNATSVSIDNGVGSQPVTGSVTVTPTQTTFYTLTATNAAGSVTAQTTVAIPPPGPKRRAARP